MENLQNITSNLDIFNRVRKVPKEAQKKITGGRMNGFTDINPMWRIQTLTELFGPVGIGWKYEIITPVDSRFQVAANGEVACFLDIHLYYKIGKDSEGNTIWSAPIFGTGGSMFITNEAKGPRTSDEATKCALTDAISVCCKALGIGADVYWAMGANTPTATTGGTKQQSTTQTGNKAQSQQKPQTQQAATQTQDQTKPDTKYQKASVPSVGDDELPDPGPKKPATTTTPTPANDIERAKLNIADVGQWNGKTLGEVATSNVEDLKAIAAQTQNPQIKKDCVTVYNSLVPKKTA